jgi:uncharacterized protein YraI
MSLCYNAARFSGKLDRNMWGRMAKHQQARFVLRRFGLFGVMNAMWLRRFFLMWSVLALLALNGAALAQDGGLLTTISKTARFRSGPGTEWFWQGNLEAGTTILLDGRAPGGGWVRGITPDAKVGWVIDSAVAASAEQIAALPSVWVDTPFTLPAPAGTGSLIPIGPGSQPSADPQPAQPAQPQALAPVAGPLPEGGLQVEAGSNLNVRQEPTTNSPIIARITTGTIVSLDGRDPSQQWVRGTLPGGTKGWMSVRFLIITAQQVVSLPIVQGGASVAAAASAAPAGSPTPIPALPAAPIVSTAPVRGFSYGGHASGLGEQTVNAMRLAGMTWVKKQVRYFQGQTADVVSGLIADAHSKGFRILLGIVGSAGELNNGGYFDQYAAFVAGAAALGADAIEVWNEPNIDREWPTGQIDPARFTQLLATAYNAIKGANPNTLVISGAPAPTGFFGGCSAQGCDDNAFIAGMAAAGAARYMDCVGVHYNEGIVAPDQTSGDPRGSSGYYTRYFWGMVNTYYNAFRGARPLCFTELGYLTPEGYPPLPGGFAWAQNVTVAQQAAWLDRAVQLSASSGKVRLVIIWNVDFTNYGDDPMGGYAIIRPGGACPACEALGS